VSSCVVVPRFSKPTTTQLPLPLFPSPAGGPGPVFSTVAPVEPHSSSTRGCPPSLLSFSKTLFPLALEWLALSPPANPTFPDRPKFLKTIVSRSVELLASSCSPLLATVTARFPLRSPFLPPPTNLDVVFPPLPTAKTRSPFSPLRTGSPYAKLFFTLPSSCISYRVRPPPGTFRRVKKMITASCPDALGFFPSKSHQFPCFSSFSKSTASLDILFAEARIFFLHSFPAFYRFFKAPPSPRGRRQNLLLAIPASPCGGISVSPETRIFAGGSDAPVHAPRFPHADRDAEGLPPRQGAEFQ